MKENYWTLAGYRLPTEAEFEYAARADSETARYFGETIDLMHKYAWVVENSNDRTWPVGQLKPNDFGLFDMHGSVWEWCQERYNEVYPTANGNETVEEKEEDTKEIATSDEGSVRGGAWGTRSMYVRSSARYYCPLNKRSDFFGMRVARSLRKIENE